MTAPPRDDSPPQPPAQAWVAFYESLDRLVQEHVARSSELLRRAMALPEAADREVAQVRAALEARLDAERVRTAALLTEVKSQIADSQQLVSSLATSVDRLTTDLRDLDQRLDGALRSTTGSRSGPSSVHLAVASEAATPPASEGSAEQPCAGAAAHRPRVVA